MSQNSGNFAFNCSFTFKYCEPVKVRWLNEVITSAGFLTITISLFVVNDSEFGESKG